MRRLATCLSVCAAIYCFSGPDIARGDTVTYSFESTVPGTIAAGGNESNISFNLPQFNPVLGTLDYLDVSASVSFSDGEAVITNEEACCAGGEGYTISYQLLGSDSTGLVFANAAQATEILADLQGGASTTVPWSATGAADSGPVYFPEFIGTGSVTLYVNTSLWTSYSDEWAGGSYTFGSSPISLDLTYDYTPSPVPEPGMFGVTAGLAALLIWRALRRLFVNRAPFAVRED